MTRLTTGLGLFVAPVLLATSSAYALPVCETVRSCEQAYSICEQRRKAGRHKTRCEPILAKCRATGNWYGPLHSCRIRK